MAQPVESNATLAFGPTCCAPFVHIECRDASHEIIEENNVAGVAPPVSGWRPPGGETGTREPQRRNVSPEPGSRIYERRKASLALRRTFLERGISRRRPGEPFSDVESVAGASARLFEAPPIRAGAPARDFEMQKLSPDLRRGFSECRNVGGKVR